MKHFSKFIFIVFFYFCLQIHSLAQTLSQLLSENNQVKGLEEFKDNESSFHLKLENLRKINENHKQYGLKPVQLDIFASRVANMHCIDMIEHNYGGHWDRYGRKPFQRYGLSGGIDHVSENIYIYQLFKVIDKKEYPTTPEVNQIAGLMTKGLQTFMSEKPPHDGHRQEILNPYHTHVGLGYAIGKAGFRYCQEFIDRYLDMDPFPVTAISGTKLQLTGRTLDANYGPYGAMVYYEETIKPLTSLTQQPNRYPDFEDQVYAKIPSWDIQYNYQTRKFSIPINFETAKRGYYYVIIYVKPDVQTIPFTPTSRIEWNTKNGIPSTSIMIIVQ